MFQFDWDPIKAATNIKDHGITFDEAASVFADPLVFQEADKEHFGRLVTIGVSIRGKVLFVVVEENTHFVRIISARRATAQERKTYEEES